VPSSDHCEPLLGSQADLDVLLHAMENQLRESHSEYIDLRTSSAIAFPTALTRSTQDYCFHQLDLRPPLETLFRNCHSSSTQRKIRRADREGLTYEYGHTDLLLKTFLKLYALTRRRHQIPPQPKQWFRNLIDCFNDGLKIRIAYKNGQPVAATLAIRYKDTIVYKYGCSDSRFNNLGGTQFLFWKMIEESKKEGLLSLDLGRSDLQNTGLITFKDRLGAAKSLLTYSRFAVSKKPIVGSLLYPHVG
jgi:lipid II:glycine glycyltransferase (peptidoglycan interpeptide bridge formation enzyme)